MAETPSPSLLTEADVSAWVTERVELRRRLEELERKVAGFRLMFPDLASRLLVDWKEDRRGALVSAAKGGRKTELSPPKAALELHEQSFTAVVMALIDGEEGGRPTRWFRERLRANSKLAERDSRTPTLLNNALSRLAKAGKLRRKGSTYYHPDVYARIESGDLTEGPENEPLSFNSLMHTAMRELGRPFKAGDAIEVARHVPALAAKLGEQPGRVYSWLGREVFKNKLRKDGDFYSYPSDANEALSGNTASAPVAGEAATSPIENQPALRLIG